MGVILTVFLMAAAAPAWAQWVKVDDADNAIHYIDSTTLSKDGQVRKVWVTQYLKEKAADGGMARRALLEYDCAGTRFRILSVAKYSGALPDGKYQLSQGNTSPPGRQIPTNLPAATVQRIICAP